MLGIAIYKILPFLNGGQKLYEHVNTCSNIVSTFSVLLMGFLSTIIVIISGIKDSFFFRAYTSSGHLDTFMIYYFFTVISLLITHLLSIAALSDFFWFKVMIASVIMNVGQIVLLVIVTYRISKTE